MKKREVSGFPRRMRVWAVAPVLLVACGGAGTTASSSRRAVFGGEGAVVAAKEHPLPEDRPADSAPATKLASGPCASPSPPSDASLLDDFEDGDSAAFKGFQREGWWFSVSDPTEGAQLWPEHGNFRPERLPVAEGRKDNVFAAHFRAAGQKVWGSAWGVSLLWANQGVRCPLNLSGFAGLRFRAKGPGAVRVALAMPEAEPVDAGGICTSRCFDLHARVVYLNDRWDDYFVAWDRLAQGGWGTDVRFDPARIVSLQFSVRPADLPVDFWIDDVAFVARGDAQTLAAAQHAEPAPPPPAPAASSDGGSKPPVPSGKTTKRP